jgi:hypothetical protein
MFLQTVPLVAIMGCGVAVTPPAPRNPPSLAPLSPSPRQPDLLDVVLGRGQVHGPLIALPWVTQHSGLTGRRKVPAWLAFVGTPVVARAAWLVVEEGDDVATPVHLRAELVADWPQGCRVLAAETQGDETYVWVESVGVLDQPAGLRGVVRLAASQVMGGPLIEANTDFRNVPLFFETGTVEVFRARARESRASRGNDELDRFAHELARAMTVEPFVAEGGADLFEVWQGVFARSIDGRVFPNTVRASPYRARIDNVARSLSGFCFDTSCDTGAGAPPGSGLLFEKAGGRWTIRSIALGAEPAPPLLTTEARPLDSVLSSRFQELAGQPARVLEVAPWQTGWVALVEADGARFVLLVAGDFGTLRALPEHAEHRLVDLNGDGVTDIVMARGDAFDVQLLPAPSVQRFGSLAVWPSDDDLASSRVLATLAMLRAKTTDEAVALAREASSHLTVVHEKEACALLRRARRVSRFRQLTTPTVRMIQFSDPHDIGGRRHFIDLRGLRDEDLESLGQDCGADPSERFECEGSVCGSFMNALGHFYWFEREGSTLKLAAAAVYVGG